MKFKLNPIILASGLYLCSTPSFATQINITLSASVNVADQNGNFNNTASSNTQVNIYAADTLFSDPPVINGFVYGDSDGHSSASAATGMQGDSTVVSNLRQSALVLNDSSTTQKYDFNFLINSGGLEASFSNVNANNYLNASYSADIFLNGTSIWSSKAGLSGNIFDQSINKAGVDLNPLISDGARASFYNWNPYAGSLDLGTLDAGKSFLLEYLITTTASGTLPYDECGGYGFGNQINDENFDSATATYCRAIAYSHFSDPFDFNSDNNLFSLNSIQSTEIHTTNVPEPASLVLLGAGLAGLAFRRRAKKSV